MIWGHEFLHVTTAVVFFHKVARHCIAPCAAPCVVAGVVALSFLLNLVRQKKIGWKEQLIMVSAFLWRSHF